MSFANEAVLSQNIFYSNWKEKIQANFGTQTENGFVNSYILLHNGSAVKTALPSTILLSHFLTKRTPNVLGPQWHDTVQPASVQ